ncbi:MAG: hypothetical protein CM1200mP28_14880 [Deltaproteobacteria bacterium]|nr:MAG: hypothetical protein CM1200mP28_14880 [Deltaproteobacteria bacterium]
MTPKSIQSISDDKKIHHIIHYMDSAFLRLQLERVHLVSFSVWMVRSSSCETWNDPVPMLDLLIVPECL